MNKKLYLFINGFTITIFIFVGIFFIWLAWNIKESDYTNNLKFTDSIVVFINGMEVTEDEFRLHLNRNIAMTYNYFFKKYHVTNHSDFWQKCFNGEIPLEYIKTKTLEKLIHIKTIQKLAIELGLLKNYSFNEFTKQWKEENYKRRLKYQEGEIVYGPFQFSVEDYYDYLFSNLVIKVQNKLNETKFVPNQKELRSFYDQIKEKQFVYVPEIEVEYISFPYYDSISKSKWLKELLIIEKEIENGKEFKSYLNKFPSAYYKRTTFSDTIPIIGEDNPDREIKSFAVKLKQDELKIFDGKENSVLYLLRCIKKSPEKIYPFEKVKKDVLWIYQNVRFKEFIDKLEDEAEIIINKPVYEKIKILESR